MHLRLLTRGQSSRGRVHYSNAMLIRLLCFIFFVCFHPTVLKAEDGRIVGGFPAVPHTFPHIAHLDTASSSLFCGGSLIHESWVLSAAHCNVYYTFNVVLGDYDRSVDEGSEQIISASLVIQHPLYNSYTKENDLMVIKLATPAILSRDVEPISLPPASSEPEVGQICRICGWGNQQISGNVYPDNLRCVELPIISSQSCNDVTSYNGLVKETMFCIGSMDGGKDSCDGDSGGPAECGGELIGVVSWGYGCAYPNFPGVYVKVSMYIDWIDEQTSYN